MGSKSGQQGQTPQELALAQHAQAQLNDYQQRWLPVQQHLAKTIEQEGEPNSAAARLAAGKASTDTAMQFDKANQQAEQGLSNAGVGPGSSRANLAVAGMGTDQAAATGLGKMMSEQQISDAYTQGLGALTALGRGEKGGVSNSMEKMAQQSQAQAESDAQASMINRASNAKVGGQVVGFGLQQGGAALGNWLNSGAGGITNSSTLVSQPRGGSNFGFGTPQAGV